MIIDQLVVLTSPPFVDCAVTEAPFTAFVPISIWTLPVDAVVLERFPRLSVPDHEIVMLSVGRTRAVTTIPLIVPLALDQTNESFQLMIELSHPDPTTVPVPICEAETPRIIHWVVRENMIELTRMARKI